MIDRTGILVLASHSLELLRSTCTQVLWMEHGRIAMLGEPNEVLNAYIAAMHHRDAVG
jgi:ABC-type polysaccharide/polyol phosphate transport system ATPase subunit